MSKKNKIIPTAIYVRNVGHVQMSGNKFHGDLRILDAHTVDTIAINSNTYMTTETYRIFREFNDTINSVKDDLPDDVINDLVSRVKNMEENQGQPSFLASYNSFIGCLANHATALEPVMPLFNRFINYLSTLS